MIDKWSKKDSDKDSVSDSVCSDESQKKNYKEFSQQDFIQELEKFKDTYDKDLLNNFYKFWKEKSPGGKMRFQLEKTWETDLRLEYWQRNNTKKINGSHQQTPTKGKLGTSEARIEAARNY